MEIHQTKLKVGLWEHQTETCMEKWGANSILWALNGSVNGNAKERRNGNEAMVVMALGSDVISIRTSNKRDPEARAGKHEQHEELIERKLSFVCATRGRIFGSWLHSSLNNPAYHILNFRTVYHIPAVQRISECFIKPQRPIEDSNQIYHLTPWDITMLSMHYIQKGLLFKKPSVATNQQDFIQNLLEKMKHSLSLALNHFYPLAGRLVTHKTQDPPSYVVFIDCKNSCGASFIYSTLDMTICDILSPIDVPPIVHSLFDHDRDVVNHDGHTVPLLAIQVTELVDGVFTGCSMNHSIADGTSFWNFFNTWSEIFQFLAQGHHEHVVDVPISRQPIHDRWFPEGCSPLINLPFKHHGEFISRFESPKLRARIFHFTAESIAKLKTKANMESSTTKISSFQSLAAHVWRCITRAGRVPHSERTTCLLVANNRTRMEPPLPQEYFGNCTHGLRGGATAGELDQHDLGWAAWKLHMTVANHNDKAVKQAVKEWLQSPVVYQTHERYDQYTLLFTSSPRFNMYGNEFGMGKAVAVLSGFALKFDGKVTSYQGYEGGGSIDLDVCLLPETMHMLESDKEFMSTISSSKSRSS
ncbi:acetyltransferase protein [Spatholobus suberectus]|nr:acetyltransferase protein [Spatholobus suberectus]